MNDIIYHQSDLFGLVDQFTGQVLKML